MNDSHNRYAQWDAAYLLGALSPEERLEFEAHLDTCPTCADAVASIAGMPGLLKEVPAATAEALLIDGEGQPAATPPADLLDRMRERNRERRSRMRTRIVAGFAAAAVLVTAALLPTLVTAPTGASLTATLAQTQASPLSASVGLSELDWGTRLIIDCSYDSNGEWQVKQPASGAWRFALFIIDDQGNETQVSSWKAEPGDSVSVVASTVLTVEQIRSLQIRSLATGDTLMAVDLSST